MMDKPLAYHVDEAVRISGLGRSKLYQAVSSGELRALKCGRRTLIRAEDLEAFISSLPSIKGGISPLPLRRQGGEI
jgi:excisionase family DNA binding protein